MQSCRSGGVFWCTDLSCSLQLVSTQVSQWRNFQTIWKKGRGGMHQHSDRADKKQIFLVKLLIIFSLLAPRASKGCFLIRELLEEPKFRSVAQAGEKWQAQKILQRHVLKESSSTNHHLSSTLIPISCSIKCDTWRSLSQADYLYFLHTLTPAHLLTLAANWFSCPKHISRATAPHLSPVLVTSTCQVQGVNSHQSTSCSPAASFLFDPFVTKTAGIKETLHTIFKVLENQELLNSGQDVSWKSFHTHIARVCSTNYSITHHSLPDFSHIYT